MRPPRIQAADAMYHVSCRGNRQQDIVRDDVDRARFLAITSDVMVRRGWICLAYCLMTNHYHFLIQTPEPDLAKGMHAINYLAARTFNKRYGHKGHLFEGRYGSKLVLTDAHLLETIRYVVLNPVRAGACEFPEDWLWSSYRPAIGLSTAPPFLTLDPLLALFSSRRETAQQALREFVMGRVVLPRAA